MTIRHILQAAICHHELYRAVSGAQLMEQAILHVNPTSTSSKMSFEAFYNFVLDQAMVLDRNAKEAKGRQTNNTIRKKTKGKKDDNNQNNKTNSTTLVTTSKFTLHDYSGDLEGLGGTSNLRKNRHP